MGCRPEIQSLMREADDVKPPPVTQEEDPEAWSHATALRIDLNALQMVEALEEKVASASMQLKVISYL